MTPVSPAGLPMEIAMLRNPDLSYFHFMSRRARHTPDAAALFEHDKVLLFVCDGHQGKHRHFPEMLKFGPTLIPGYTTYPTTFTMQGFSMFCDNPSGQVVPLHSDPTIDTFFPTAKIKGQLHLVRPELIHSLDIRYQNGIQYRRRRVNLILPYREKAVGPWKTTDGKPLPRALQGWRAKEGPEKIHIVKAYMYVGRHKYWDSHIDDGYTTLQCPILFPNVEKNWLPRYYEYTRTFEETQRVWAEAQRRTG